MDGVQTPSARRPPRRTTTPEVGLLGPVCASLPSVSDPLITEHILTHPGSALSGRQSRRSPEGSGGVPGGLGG